MKKIMLSVLLGLFLGTSAWAQVDVPADPRVLSEMHKDDNLRPAKKLDSVTGKRPSPPVGSIDLKIENLEIEPEPAGIASPKIELGTYRSYRAIVTVRKTTALPTNSSFLVRTECIRNGQAETVGQARIGDAKGWHLFACYNLYPGEAGPGDCLLRTTIDAENEITETDESAVSNVWDREAILVGPSTRSSK